MVHSLSTASTDIANVTQIHSVPHMSRKRLKAMHFHWSHKSLQHGMETNHSVPHRSRNYIQLKHALPLESQIIAAWHGNKSHCAAQVTQLYTTQTCTSIGVTNHSSMAWTSTKQYKTVATSTNSKRLAIPRRCKTVAAPKRLEHKYHRRLHRGPMCCAPRVPHYPTILSARHASHHNAKRSRTRWAQVPLTITPRTPPLRKHSGARLRVGRGAFPLPAHWSCKEALGKLRGTTPYYDVGDQHRHCHAHAQQRKRCHWTRTGSRSCNDL